MTNDDGDRGDRTGSHGSDGDHGNTHRSGDGPDGPNLVAVRDGVIRELVAFARALRRAGVAVPANAGVTAARTLVEVGFDDERRARAALRAALVSRREDLLTFDRLFPEFWRRLTDGLGGYTVSGDDPRIDPGPTTVGGLPTDTESGSNDETDPNGTEETIETLASWNVPAADQGDKEKKNQDEEPLQTASYSPSGNPEPIGTTPGALAERASLDRAHRRLTRALAVLRGRRWTAAEDGRPDARRTLRRSFSTGGTVVSMPSRERARTAVRCVLLVDVSRSVLDTIDQRFLLRFLRAATGEWHRTQTFLFDTHVREVSRELNAPTSAGALRALHRAEAEWGGGTRIGNALSTVRREYPDAIDRRTVVFVISDGLEMGEIDELEDGMVWLSRRASAVLWCNPLAASPDYEPTCRGMAVAFPYVDGVFAFTGPDDLAELARQLELHGTGPIGYEHDPRRMSHNA